MKQYSFIINFKFYIIILVYHTNKQVPVHSTGLRLVLLIFVLKSRLALPAPSFAFCFSKSDTIFFFFLNFKSNVLKIVHLYANIFLSLLKDHLSSIWIFNHEKLRGRWISTFLFLILDISMQRPKKNRLKSIFLGK